MTDNKKFPHCEEWDSMPNHMKKILWPFFVTKEEYDDAIEHVMEAIYGAAECDENGKGVRVANWRKCAKSAIAAMPDRYKTGITDTIPIPNEVQEFVREVAFDITQEALAKAEAWLKGDK